MENEKFTDYLKYIFDIFFKWWWAVLTGIASVSSWLFIVDDSLKIEKFWVGIYIVVILTCFFLTLSVFLQGWNIYKKKSLFKSSVLSFQKNNLYQTSYLVVINSNIEFSNGTILELKRIANNVEVLIGLFEIVEKNLDGNYQGKLIFSTPSHLKEYAEGKYHQDDIIIKNIVNKDSIEKYAIEYSENEIRRFRQ